MMAETRSLRLVERLPKVRGAYRANVSLAQYTWFRVGGPAEILFRPEDADDLTAFMAGKPADVPVTVLGVGSNLLVRDGGIPGVSIRLGKGFAGLSRDGDILRAGAGCLDANVALQAAHWGMGGLEFLSGIPGTIGGALRMNAGAYGREMKDVTLAAEAIDADGNRRYATNGAMCFGYRHTGMPADWIFVAAELKTASADPAAIAAAMAEIQAKREATQPVRTRTGGSTFANPTETSEARTKAWELIDRAGCRGLTRGGAMVSDKHCNSPRSPMRSSTRCMAAMPRTAPFKACSILPAFPTRIRVCSPRPWRWTSRWRARSSQATACPSPKAAYSTAKTCSRAAPWPRPS
jgi:UDP-N-acetylmuramate dehydrogenase